MSDLYDSDSELLSTASAHDSETDSLLEDDQIQFDEDLTSSQGQSSTAEQAAKAIEAAEESSSTALRDEDELPPEPTSRIPRWPDEHTPLLDAGPAPPDYSQATAWRRTRLVNDSSDTRAESIDDLYSRSVVSHRSEEALLPAYTDGDGHNAIQGKDTSRARKRRCYGIIAAIVVIVLASAITIFWKLRTPYRIRSPPQRNPRKDHPQLDGCNLSTFSEYKIYEFANPIDFSLTFDMESTDTPDIPMVRTLHIFAGSEEQDPAIEVWMNVASSSDYYVENWRAIQSYDDILIQDALLSRNDSNHRNTSESCAHLWVAIFVKPGMHFSTFLVWAGPMNVSYGHADIGAQGDERTAWDNRGQLDMVARNQLAIWTESGHIDCWRMSSPTVLLYTQTGHITGTYDLRKELYIQGSKGFVNVTIEPIPPGESSYTAPKFTLKSKLDWYHVLFPLVDPDELLGWASNITIRSGYDPQHLFGFLKIRPRLFDD